MSDINGYIPGGLNSALVSLTGGIVVWWGMIESSLATDVLSMNSLPAVAADKECSPLQIATKRLIAQWARARRIIHSTWQDDTFDLELTVQDLRFCAEVRNRLVHSFWGYGSPNHSRDDFVISRMTLSKTNGSLEFERYLIETDTLDAFNTRLFNLHTRLVAASMNLHFGLIGPARSPPPKAPKGAEPIVIDARTPPPKSILDQ